MKTKNNTVYVLSSRIYNGSLYLKNSRQARATLKLNEAKVFKSEDQVKHFLGKCKAEYWQIQPISSKIIFEAKLKGI